MAADRQSPVAVRQWLVRLGHLCFDDFLLLPPQTLDCEHWNPNMASDWALATNNAPHIQVRFPPGHCNLQTANCELEPSLGDVQAAQQRLVAHFAYDLLRAKAPPIYDALPWHDWEFSIVTKKFPLWKTRFLLAGDGTTVAMCRCRKSAGVYVVEPCETMAHYIGRKAEVEKVHRFRLVSPKPQATSFKLLSAIPLPDKAVDLAIIGSVPRLDTGNWQMVTREMLRVSCNVLIIENSPLSQPLDEKLLTGFGFQPASVAVAGLGRRRCSWRTYLESHL